ncbi:hypothetical protein [Pseudoruegeria sp. SHC-113]|uniref:hypothetical protein n=1 Tax=Pseudoruegeria sp. SHC-113 TaxID=2855439 RepID=UPI0021BAF9DC|nr:hypothetical protein [Pseudoruegeria sp. SHC-113]MCT8161868.1 sulfotransferase [Pseudoruegeria sp. SHC-113]
MPSPTNFVLLSNARSGTTLVTSTLNSHPQICCHGEIFHPKPKFHFREIWADHNDPADYADRPLALARAVLEDPRTAEAYPIIGFKMWKAQAPGACKALCGDPSVRKIILERKNKLATYSSGMLAKQTGVWNVPSDKKNLDLAPEKLPFNGDRFRKYVETQRSVFDFYDSHVAGDVYRLAYQEVNAKAFADLLAFLGAPAAELEVGKKKLHPSDILGRYAEERHDEIRRTLDALGHPEWITEEMAA